MTNPITKAALTSARKRLVEMMQEINYGRIEGLEVRESDPVFDPPPTMVRLFLFGRDNDPSASFAIDGFALKKSVAELFEIFDRERSFTIRELMIDGGLPVRMSLADAARV
ncbi:MAG: hypothetical protein KAY32_16330 [Candidatus Eisenbacteria sp.]|nr:hypothetical protein [Candidatus Eisenbacteria bacterium]